MSKFNAYCGIEVNWVWPHLYKKKSQHNLALIAQGKILLSLIHTVDLQCIFSAQNFQGCWWLSVWNACRICLKDLSCRPEKRYFELKESWNCRVLLLKNIDWSISSNAHGTVSAFRAYIHIASKLNDKENCPASCRNHTYTSCCESSVMPHKNIGQVWYNVPNPCKNHKENNEGHDL